MDSCQKDLLRETEQATLSAMMRTQNAEIVALIDRIMALETSIL